MNETAQPRILMCAPDHYRVRYAINPWMTGEEGRVKPDTAVRQWNGLLDAISPLAAVNFIEQSPSQPDMVFTANAGLVVRGVFVPSRFRFPERAGEEPHFATWALSNGYNVVSLPEGIHFEGAGDALLDRGMPVLWVGHGFRTDERACAALRDVVKPLSFVIEPLRLVNPHYYHLDTCFCPLAGGRLLYYSPAFAEESIRRLESVVPAEKRYAVSASDAEAFACNAVNLDGTVVLNRASSQLRSQLADWGLRCVETPLGEFMRAGGAAKCLTLRLDEPAPSQEQALLHRGSPMP